MAARWAKPLAVLALAAIAMVSLGLAGCTSVGTAGKGGGPRHGSAVFGFYDIEPDPDGYTPGGPAFLDALRDLSGGRLALVARNSREGGPAGLIDRVRSGAIQGAWVQASDLEAAGIGRMAALSAPFEVTTYAEAAALTQPDIAAQFLSGFDEDGLTALALWPGSLRRPAGQAGSLLGPDSWAGVRVWAASPTQRATLAALGATPTSDPRDVQVSDLPEMVREDLAAALPHLTSNVVFWPRWWVLVANSEWVDSLSEAERAWVDEAAESARRTAVGTQPPETELAAHLCEAGVRFQTASPAQLTALHRAVEPVIRQLEAVPENAGLLDVVRRTRAAVAAGEISDLEVSPYCKGEVTPLEEIGSYPRTRSAIPPGVYRAHLSEEDIASAGSMKTRDAQVVTLTISADGSYENASRFDNDGTSMIFEAGEVFGDDHVAYFVNSLSRLTELQTRGESACVWTQASLGCITNTEPYSVTWTEGADGSLHFSDPRGMNPDPVTVLGLTAIPFRRVS